MKDRTNVLRVPVGLFRDMMRRSDAEIFMQDSRIKITSSSARDSPSPCGEKEPETRQKNFEVR
ncbi:MAG: hypothetical protein WC985_03845 [Thermoplasmata archaeon]